MARYLVKMVNTYTGEVLEVMDEVFDSHEEAEDFASVCSSNYAAGGETLGLAGEDYDDSDEVDYIVEEE